MIQKGEKRAVGDLRGLLVAEPIPNVDENVFGCHIEPSEARQPGFLRMSRLSAASSPFIPAIAS